MRQINVYKFSEKMPDLEKGLLIIPTRMDFCKGRLVNQKHELEGYIEDTDDADTISYFRNKITKIEEAHEELAIHWVDDEEYKNTPVKDISDWEWLYIEETKYEGAQKEETKNDN